MLAHRLIILLSLALAVPTYAAERKGIIAICRDAVLSLFRPAPPVVEGGVTLKLDPRDGYNVLSNGHMVTGPWDYPTGVVLHGLGLDDVATIRGKRVLSVGEGYSDLLQTLLDAGADARAVDLWYHNEKYPRSYIGKQMRAFCEKHGERLLRGSATDLPVDAGSVDILVSHKMVTNDMPQADQRKVMDDTVRVLAKGGEARIYGLSKASAEENAAYLREKGLTAEYETK